MKRSGIDSQVIRAHQNRVYKELYQIVKQIISILKYLHKKNITHSNLCSSNILISRIKQSPDRSEYGKHYLGHFQLSYVKVKDFSKASIDRLNNQKEMFELSQFNEAKNNQHIEGDMRSIMSPYNDMDFDTSPLIKEDHQHFLCIQKSMDYLQGHAQVVPLYYRAPETIMHFNYQLFEDIHISDPEEEKVEYDVRSNKRDRTPDGKNDLEGEVYQNSSSNEIDQLFSSSIKKKVQSQN